MICRGCEGIVALSFKKCQPGEDNGFTDRAAAVVPIVREAAGKVAKQRALVVPLDRKETNRDLSWRVTVSRRHFAVSPATTISAVRDVQTINYYLRYYQRSAIDFWQHLTPMQYGCLLISVAVVGWIMMRSANRR